MKFEIEDQFDGLNPRGILVARDRYGGSYSGHAYTAWNYGICIKGNPIDDVRLFWAHGEPSDASAGDSTCEEFWNSLRKDPKNFPIYGGGNTPEEAVGNLIYKLNDLGYYAEGLFSFILAVDGYINPVNPKSMEFIRLIKDYLIKDFIMRNGAGNE